MASFVAQVLDVFEEPLVKSAPVKLGHWGPLPIIAIGPKGGKIVGYKSDGKPIYAGSTAAKKLVEKLKTPRAKSDTAELIDWLIGIGIPAKKDPESSMVMVSKTSGKLLEDHFGIKPQTGAKASYFTKKQLLGFYGKPLTPKSEAAHATFQAKAASGELDKDPFPPLNTLQWKSKNIGGSHNVGMLVDGEGRKWVWKWGIPKINRAEEAASRIGRLILGPENVPAAKVVEWNGQEGLLMEFRPGSDIGPSHSNPDNDNLNKWMPQVLQQHVYDWVISNHDSHAGNFLVGPDSFNSIDKGQSWRFFGKDKLNETYQPNNSSQIYIKLWERWKAGKFPQWTEDKILAIISDTLDKVEAITKEQFESIVAPYVALRSGLSTSDLYKRVLSARKDFEKHLSKVFGHKVTLAHKQKSPDNFETMPESESEAGPSKIAPMKGKKWTNVEPDQITAETFKGLDYEKLGAVSVVWREDGFTYEASLAGDGKWGLKKKASSEPHIWFTADELVGQIKPEPNTLVSIEWKKPTLKTVKGPALSESVLLDYWKKNPDQKMFASELAYAFEVSPQKAASVLSSMYEDGVLDRYKANDGTWVYTLVQGKPEPTDLPVIEHSSYAQKILDKLKATDGGINIMDLKGGMPDEVFHEAVKELKEKNLIEGVPYGGGGYSQVTYYYKPPAPQPLDLGKVKKILTEAKLIEPDAPPTEAQTEPIDEKPEPGWPVTKGKTIVFNPGTAPPPDVEWPKGYPGPGFKVQKSYKGKIYTVEFKLETGTNKPTFWVYFPNGQVQVYDSPNAASDSWVLFNKGLPLNANASDKKYKYKVSYPAAKAFDLKKFEAELQAAHTANPEEMAEKLGSPPPPPDDEPQPAPGNPPSGWQVPKPLPLKMLHINAMGEAPTGTIIGWKQTETDGATSWMRAVKQANGDWNVFEGQKKLDFIGEKSAQQVFQDHWNLEDGDAWSWVPTNQKYDSKFLDDQPEGSVLQWQVPNTDIGSLKLETIKIVKKDTGNWEGGFSEGVDTVMSPGMWENWLQKMVPHSLMNLTVSMPEAGYSSTKTEATMAKLTAGGPNTNVQKEDLTQLVLEDMPIGTSINWQGQDQSWDYTYEKTGPDTWKATASGAEYGSTQIYQGTSYAKPNTITMSLPTTKEPAPKVDAEKAGFKKGKGATAPTDYASVLPPGYTKTVKKKFTLVDGSKQKFDVTLSITDAGKYAVTLQGAQKAHEFDSLSMASDWVWVNQKGYESIEQYKEKTGKKKVPSGGGWKFWGIDPSTIMPQEPKADEVLAAKTAPGVTELKFQGKVIFPAAALDAAKPGAVLQFNFHDKQWEETIGEEKKWTNVVTKNEDGDWTIHYDSGGTAGATSQLLEDWQHEMNSLDTIGYGPGVTVPAETTPSEDNFETMPDFKGMSEDEVQNKLATMPAGTVLKYTFDTGSSAEPNVQTYTATKNSKGKWNEVDPEGQSSVNFNIHLDLKSSSSKLVSINAGGPAPIEVTDTLTYEEFQQTPYNHIVSGLFAGEPFYLKRGPWGWLQWNKDANKWEDTTAMNALELAESAKKGTLFYLYQNSDGQTVGEIHETQPPPHPSLKLNSYEYPEWMAAAVDLKKLTAGTKIVWKDGEGEEQWAEKVSASTWKLSLPNTAEVGANSAHKLMTEPGNHGWEKVSGTLLPAWAATESKLNSLLEGTVVMWKDADGFLHTAKKLGEKFLWNVDSNPDQDTSTMLVHHSLKEEGASEWSVHPPGTTPPTVPNWDTWTEKDLAPKDAPVGTAWQYNIGEGPISIVKTEPNLFVVSFDKEVYKWSATETLTTLANVASSQGLSPANSPVKILLPEGQQLPIEVVALPPPAKLEQLKPVQKKKKLEQSVYKNAKLFNPWSILDEAPKLSEFFTEAIHTQLDESSKVPENGMVPPAAKSSKWPAWVPPMGLLIKGEHNGQTYYMTTTKAGWDVDGLEPWKTTGFAIFDAAGNLHSGSGNTPTAAFKNAANNAGLPNNIKELHSIFNLKGVKFMPGETTKSIMTGSGPSNLPDADALWKGDIMPTDIKDGQVKAYFPLSYILSHKIPNHTVKPHEDDLDSVVVAVPKEAEDALKAVITETIGPSAFKSNGTQSHVVLTVKDFHQEYGVVADAHKAAGFPQTVSDDNFETMPEGYPKLVEPQSADSFTLRKWASSAPAGTTWWVEGTDYLVQKEGPNNWTISHPGGDITVNDKSLVASLQASPAWEQLVVLPPEMTPKDLKGKSVAAKSAAIKKNAAMLAKQKLAKAVAAWSKEYPAVTDKAAGIALAYVQKDLIDLDVKSKMYARVGKDGDILLGGTDPKEFEGFIGAIFGTDHQLESVETPLGKFWKVTLPQLQKLYPASTTIEGPDGKPYPHGTTFETKQLTTDKEDLIEPLITKFAPHKSDENLVAAKLVGTGEEQKEALTNLLAEHDVPIQGDILIGGKYTMAFVKKADLKKVGKTEEIVEPQVPAQPNPFVAASLPGMGVQKDGEEANVNRGDLGALETIEVPQGGHWIRCGKAGVLDGNQVFVTKTRDPGTQEEFYEVYVKPEYDGLFSGEQLTYKSSVFFPQKKWNDKAKTWDYTSGDAFPSSDSHGWEGNTSGGATLTLLGDKYPDFKNLLRVKIPATADVETELAEAFQKIGVDASAALAEPDDDDLRKYKKIQVVRSLLGPKGRKLTKTLATNEKKLDEVITKAGLSISVVEDAKVTVEAQGKHCVILDDLKFPHKKAKFVYQGRGSMGKTIGGLIGTGSTGVGSNRLKICLGIGAKGAGSAGSDLGTGGSNACFTRMGNLDTYGYHSSDWGYKCSGAKVIYHPRVLNRADWYAWNHDAFGSISGAESSSANQRQEVLTNAAESNEVNFEHALSNKDIVGIICPGSEYVEAVKAGFEKHGITEVNGIPIDDLIFKYEGGSRQAVYDHFKERLDTP